MEGVNGLNKGLIYGLILLMMLSYMNALPIIYSQEFPTKVLIILAPGMNYQKFNELLGANVTFVRESKIIELKQYPPYTSLYYEYLLLSPNGYDLSMGIPIDNYVLSWNGGKIDPTRLINQSKIVEMWGDLDTVFINVRIVSPLNHSRTVNLEYELEKTVIPPTLFELEVNTSKHWSLLNTDIRVTLVNNSYIIDIVDYGVKFNLSRNNPVSPVITLSISENKTENIVPGEYKLRFRIHVINDNRILLLTLGTRNPNEGFSEFYHGYDRPITPHLILDNTILDKLSPEMILWTIDQVVGFYVNLADYVLTKYNKLITYAYYPLFEETYKMLKFIDNESLANEIIERVYGGFNEFIKKARVKMGEAVTITYVISPYTITEQQMDLNLNYVAPGIVKYSVSIIQDLVSHEISFSIETISGAKYVFITDNRIGYGKGYIMIYPSLLDTDISPISAKSLQLFNILAGSSGYGLKQLIRRVDDLNEEVTKLNTKVNELNSTNANLRREIENLKKALGESNATVINLRNEIASLREQINRIEDEKRQVYMYLSMGFVAAIILSLVYILIVRAIARKR